MEAHLQHTTTTTTSTTTTQIEQAGGLSTTGTQRILDILPSDIHQRVPIYIGSKDDISDLIELLKKEP